ncbi:MAG: endonuclease dU [Promethearchaeota archaeon]|jgi:endonuclease V-like protein UPF0215 family
MKENPITIGFDDATFTLNSNRKTTELIGVVCQGTRLISVVKAEIDIDGYNSTEKIIELVKQNEKQVQFILTHTITFGGFNIVNLHRIYNKCNKPIIAINERKVNLDSVVKALEKNFPNHYKEKIQNIINAGNLYHTSVHTAGGLSDIYFHKKGIKLNEIDSLLQKICIDSKLPECLRMAHIVGKLFSE